MSAARRIGIASAWLALVTITGYKGYELRGQRRELDALQKRRVDLIRESASLRKFAEATSHDLAEAERQLAELSRSTANPVLTPGRQAEVNAWLARVKRLRGLFDEQPAQRIPEMQLLTAPDWLRLAKTARFDSDVETRKALAAVRNRAVWIFVDRLRLALAKFLQANGVGMPSSVVAMAPYFDSAADQTILGQYEIISRPSLPNQHSANWALQNKSAIDPDFDDRCVIGPGGLDASSGPMAWVTNFRERYQRAAKAYADANKIPAPRSIAAVMPYFDPPLDAASAGRLLKAEREQPLRLPPIRR